MVYKYKGLDVKGEKCRGVIEASDLEDAKKRLRSKQIYYTSISERSETRLATFTLSRRKNFTPQELATLSRDLSIYIKAGISIVNALKLAKNQYKKNRKVSNFLNTVMTLLDEGKSFYQALETQSIIKLPEFYKQSIKVSEDSGILQEVLLELSLFLKEQARIDKQIKGAFAYPMFIIIVSLFMVGFMIAYVVPKITGIFDQLDQELPGITQFVILIGDILTAHYAAIGIAIIAVITLYTTLMKMHSKFRYAVHRAQLSLPFFGSIIQTSELGRFSYISSVLLRSGVPFVQTTNLAANILNNDVLKKQFVDASKKVVEGSKFSSAIHKGSFEIDSTFTQAIALGEETSEVPAILNNLSELYFEDNRDKIDMVLSLLEPILMLFVGGMIGFIVTAMLLPIFSMNIG